MTDQQQRYTDAENARKRNDDNIKTLVKIMLCSTFLFNFVQANYLLLFFIALFFSSLIFIVDYISNYIYYTTLEENNYEEVNIPNKWCDTVIIFCGITSLLFFNIGLLLTIL